MHRPTTSTSEHIVVAKIYASNLDTLGEGLLALTDPDTWVVPLLVGLIETIGVTDLCLDVRLLVLHEVPDTNEVRELGVSIDVHLYDAALDGSLDFVLLRARSTVEHKVQRLLDLATELLRRISLVLGEQLRLQLDVSGLVHTVDVSERSGDAEVRADGGQGLVDVVDVFGLGYRLALSTPVLSTPSSSPPVMPISISSQMLTLAMRVKYLTQVAMFSSLGSSERSSMCEEKSGSWCTLKYASSASSIPSNHGRSL